MKILLVSQYFWPENFIINDLVKYLADNGHQIKVLTGKPNYPQGVIYQGYQKKGCVEENYYHNVTVFRAPLSPRRSGGAINLLINYFSFLINGIRYFPKAIRDDSFDIIFSIGLSPVISIIPAIWLKRKYKYHLVTWIQDLWPESLIATGYVNNKGLLNFISKGVKRIYQQSDTILMQSEAFRPFMTRYIDSNKCIYYPNSYNYEHFTHIQPMSLPDSLVRLLSDYFCVVFAGNVGEAQSIDTWIEAACLLSDLPLFRLVVLGDGSCLSLLEQRMQEKQITNIILAGRFPAGQMPHIYRLAQGLLVTLKQNSVVSSTIPSKIQGYLASGRPIIAALDGEGARVITEAGAGLVCAAEDFVNLAECIRTLYQMPRETREKLGQSGHAYFMQHFDMKTLAHNLIDIFNERLTVV